MSSVDLIYKLNGNMDEGINVNDLSPFLLSLGQLISEAHRTLHPNNKDISVNIKPFQKGSFEINLLVYPQQIMSFLSNGQGKDIKDALEIVGIITGISGFTLLEVIRRLKGKCKSIQPLESGEFRYESDDNTALTVDSRVHSLFQNCNIHNHIYNGIAKPLEVSGVTSAESYLKDDEEKTKVVYENDIVQPIKTYAKSEIVGVDIEQLTESTRVMYVHPKRLSVEGDRDHWSFRIGKDYIITATILDKDFLNKIKRGAIRLSRSDELKVLVIERQVRKDNDISISWDIIEVQDYKAGPEQTEIEYETGQDE